MPRSSKNTRTAVEFDRQREGSGTSEWAEVTENIAVGCKNNCKYCYAAEKAARHKIKARDDWDNERFSKRSKITTYEARDGVIMFPTAHDITPFNVVDYIRVAKLILEKGNQLLIVTKPRVECVTAMLEAFALYKEQILFRFTIGTMHTELTKFWEPGAPMPAERLLCLKMAFEAGFRTSISIEPIVGGMDSVEDVVRNGDIYVTDSIWVGKMNKVRTRVDPEFLEQVKIIEKLQSDACILDLVSRYQNHPKIRWKDSIHEIINKHVER